MPKRALLLGLKLAVSAGLIAWLWSRFDFPAAFDTIVTMAWPLAAAAFAVLLFHGVLSAWRWRTIVLRQGGALPWSEALRLFFIAMFFNQTLSTTIGGDAARVWMLHRDGAAVGTATGGIVLERVAGFLALVPLILYAAITLPRTAEAGLIASGLIVLGIALPLLAASKFARAATPWIAAIGRFAVSGREILLSASGLLILAQSLIIHLGAGLATYLLAEAAGASPGLGVCLALTPPVLMLATLPISLGGWGPREAVLIWLFGLYGIAAEAALAVSVALGLLVMAAGLPGAALMLSRSTRRPSTG